MNILIIHAHWNNRGDEAALRAMIDELVKYDPNCSIKVLLVTDVVEQFDYDGNITAETLQYPRTRDFYMEAPLLLFSRGKLLMSKRAKYFKKLVQDADLVIHGPGGPSIGDIYLEDEKFYLYKLMLVNKWGTPYAFYAPSMGPFDIEKHRIRNKIRRKILNDASIFCLREPVSKSYVEELSNVKEPVVTLDSAFQHPVDIAKYRKQLEQYTQLYKFLEKYPKVVGITITDLMWNPKYRGNTVLKGTINETFVSMIRYLRNKGFAILFIPQLFGRQQDKQYMEGFAVEGCIVMSDEYDCYFQQYIISKMYALIGMRYHSNIFSAKVGCPFVSIAYEQKMSGFMDKMKLNDYCIGIDELSYQRLKEVFENVVDSYDEYREYLVSCSKELQKEAAKTTEMIIQFLESKH